MSSLAANNRYIRKIIDEHNDICVKLVSNKLLLEKKEVSSHSIQDNKFKVTWSGRCQSSKVTFSNTKSAKEIHDELLANRQFLMLFFDKSILQAEYVVSGGKIVKQRLQFIKIYDYIEQEGYNDNYFDEGLREIPIPIFIRFDYDPQNHVDLKHSKSHLSISNHNNCRIPVSRNITLKQFVSFILKEVYDNYDIKFTTYLEHEETITEAEKSVIHLVG